MDNAKANLRAQWQFLEQVCMFGLLIGTSNALYTQIWRSCTPLCISRYLEIKGGGAGVTWSPDLPCVQMHVKCMDKDRNGIAADNSRGKMTEELCSKNTFRRRFTLIVDQQNESDQTVNGPYKAIILVFSLWVKESKTYYGSTYLLTKKT